MKSKFLIPVLAMFFAIGMSFATENTIGDPTEDYIRVNGTFMSLDTEINCGDGQAPCQVRLQNGQVHEVYDDKSLSSLKDGDGQIRQL